MVLEFLLLFRCLNLSFLSLEKRQKVIKKFELIYTKVVKNFEYKKNNNRYWDEAKLY